MRNLSTVCVSPTGIGHRLIYRKAYPNDPPFAVDILIQYTPKGVFLIMQITLFLKID